MTEDSNKLYFIRLVPKDPEENIGSIMRDLGNSTLPSCGFFGEYTLNNSKPKWAILRFEPYSKDLNTGDKHDTREAALKEALAYLSNKGFRAVPFDLK